MSEFEQSLVINKNLIKKYGLNIAVVLAELASKSKTPESYFECSVSELTESAGITRWSQNKAVEKITELGLVEVCVKGCPPKRYFRLNYDNLPECLKKKPRGEPQEYLESTKPKSMHPGKTQLREEFEQLWSIYPNKQGKQKAYKAYEKAIQEGETFEKVMQGLQGYIFYIEQQGTEQQYVKHGSTWFNQRCWNDDYAIIEREPKIPPRRETLYERNRRTVAEILREIDEEERSGQTRDNCIFDVNIDELLQRR